MYFIAKIIKHTSAKLTEDNIRYPTYFYGTLNNTVITTILCVCVCACFPSKDTLKSLALNRNIRPSGSLYHLESKCEVILSYHGYWWEGSTEIKMLHCREINYFKMSIIISESVITSIISKKKFISSVFHILIFFFFYEIIRYICFAFLTKNSILK